MSKPNNLFLLSIQSRKFFRYLSCSLMVTLINLNVYAEIPNTLAQTLHWELNGNSANKGSQRKSTAKFDMYHYEVPLSLISQKDSFIENISLEMENALIFKKNGVDYLRWIINPEDSAHHLKIRKLLKENNLDATPKHYFTGYLTASRSMYIEAPNPSNPEKPIIFSGKVSTTWTGGRFRKHKNVDKKQVIDSRMSRLQAQSVLKNGNVKFKNLLLLEEPAGFYIEKDSKSGKKRDKVEQGFIIRDLGPLTKEDHYYLPGFSVLHEKVGAQIATLNGSHDTKQFWVDNYVIPLAKASAEFAGYMGLAMTSSHNQQWLVELDKKFKPTGRIVLRDFNDSNVFKPFYDGSNIPLDKKLLEVYADDKKYVREALVIQLGIFHGTDLPSWIRKSQVKPISAEYYKAFEKRYHEITGISMKELTNRPPTLYNAPRYSIKSYKNTVKGQWTRNWKEYFAAGPCFRGADSIVLKNGQVKDCKDVLKEFAAKAAASKNLHQEESAVSCGYTASEENVIIKKVSKKYKRMMKKYFPQ